MKILNLSNSRTGTGIKTSFRTQQSSIILKIYFFLFMGLLFFDICPIYAQCDRIIPYEEIDDLPIITIKVNFHFIPNSEGNSYGIGDFPAGQTGEWFADELINAVNNNLLPNIPQNQLNGPNGSSPLILPNGDAKIRFKLYPNKEEALHYYSIGDIHESKYGDEVLDVVVTDNGGFLGGSGEANTTRINLFNYFKENTDISTKILAQVTFIHEALHTFGLEHSHHCDVAAYDLDPNLECTLSETGCNDIANNCLEDIGNNLMNGTIESDIVRAITPGQLNTYFHHFYETDFTNFCIEDCEKNEPPLYLNSSTPIVWDHPRFLFRDIVILSGTTLKIRCNTFMASNAKIYVRQGARLIVENCKISSICGNNQEWRGIEVNGNSDKEHQLYMLDENIPLLPDDPGVAILGHARIENAGTAISASRSGIDYETQLKQRGGLIYANETEFNNNRRAA